MGYIEDIAGSAAENNFNALTPDVNDPQEVIEATTNVATGMVNPMGPANAITEIQETSNEVEERQEQQLQDAQQAQEDAADQTVQEFRDENPQLDLLNPNDVEDPDKTVSEELEDTTADFERDWMSSQYIDQQVEDGGAVVNGYQAAEDTAKDVAEDVEQTWNENTPDLPNNEKIMKYLKYGLIILASGVALYLLKPVLTILAELLGFFN